MGGKQSSVNFNMVKTAHVWALNNYYKCTAFPNGVWEQRNKRTQELKQLEPVTLFQTIKIRNAFLVITFSSWHSYFTSSFLCFLPYILCVYIILITNYFKRQSYEGLNFDIKCILSYNTCPASVFLYFFYIVPVNYGLGFLIGRNLYRFLVKFLS